MIWLDRDIGFLPSYKKQGSAVPAMKKMEAGTRDKRSSKVLQLIGVAHFIFRFVRSYERIF